MYLIVGLGNPENEYAHTRHNMGFDTINQIAKNNNIQITKNKLGEDFDYKKVGDLCNMGIVYISAIFIVVLCFFLAESSIEKRVPLITCKIILFIISFFASFSALIEGISNLPPQSLPSQQEKVNK